MITDIFTTDLDKANYFKYKLIKKTNKLRFRYEI